MKRDYKNITAMKTYFKIGLLLLTLSFSLTSCREQSEKEKLIEEMESTGAEIKEKTEGDESKLKMETENKEVKIKEEDGETKIKVEEDNK